LVRRIRSISNDVSRLTFLKSLEAKPEPPPVKTKEKPPKKTPRKTTSKRRKNSLDNT